MPGDPLQTDVADFARGWLTGAAGVVSVASGAATVAAGALTASAVATAAGVVVAGFRLLADCSVGTTAEAPGGATAISTETGAGAA